MQTWHSIRGLFAQSQDCCADRESVVCARKSEDGANPHFVHNIYYLCVCVSHNTYCVHSVGL